MSARLQRVLVGAQLAVSLVLLMATGSFLQSVAQAARADVGFATDGRVTVSFDLKLQRYSGARAAAFYRQVRERVAALPGVRDATYVADVPLGGRVTFNPIYPEGRPVNPEVRPLTTMVDFVGPRFFETLNLPIRRGRALTDWDLAAIPRVAVVNEALAARLSPDGSAIGQRVSLGNPTAPPVEIVGISGNVVIDEFGEAPVPTVFLPHRGEAAEVALILWTTLPPASAWKAVETIVRSTDGSVVLFEEKTMAQHLSDRMDGERGLSRALGVAGALALGLAAFGLYGVLSYTVTRRSREIGVRVALGATRRDVVRLFMAEGLRVAAGGLVAGIIPGMALAVLLSGSLFGVRTLEPWTTIGPAILLAGAALAASYLPVRRALRVDPMAALRRD